MNLNDITSKRFEKSAFGYKNEEVDDYLKEVSREVARVTSEKDELEKKIQILADKVREYRQDEDALKDALLGAQKQAHKVVAEANAKAKNIIEEAEIKADSLVSETTKREEEKVTQIKAEIDKENKNLTRVQKDVADFKKSLFEMYKAHLEMISSLPEGEGEEEAVFEEPAKSVEEPKKSSKPQKSNPFGTANTVTIDKPFGDLKFGQNNN